MMTQHINIPSNITYEWGSPIGHPPQSNYMLLHMNDQMIQEVAREESLPSIQDCRLCWNNHTARCPLTLHTPSLAKAWMWLLITGHFSGTWEQFSPDALPGLLWVTVGIKPRMLPLPQSHGYSKTTQHTFRNENTKEVHQQWTQVKLHQSTANVVIPYRTMH